MNNDLQQQNELADALIEKLERIKALWTEIPSADDMAELAAGAATLAASLEHSQAIVTSDDFPTADDMAELASEANRIADSVGRLG